MSKKDIFDINKIVCPLCGKTHPVTRNGFNSYTYHCWVFQKELFMLMQNWKPKGQYNYFKEWIGKCERVKDFEI